MNKPLHYFDYAAATPLDPGVNEAMRPYLEAEFANPSSRYGTARVTRRAVEGARAAVADALGAKVTEIVFTGSATESNNLAVQGVLRAARLASGGDAPPHWVTSAIEHDATLAQVAPLERQGYPGTIVGVDGSGIVAPRAVVAAVTDDTVLVSLMLANNEIGTIQPVAEVAWLLAATRADRLERGVDRPLYLHTDAAQAGNYLDLHVTRLGVDLLTLNASKLYGPKGVGVLYVRHGTELEPLLYGGGQERGRRSGTENVAGAVGLAAALTAAQGRRAAEARRLLQLRDGLHQRLVAAIPDLHLNGDRQRRLPANLNYTVPGAEGEALVLYLDGAGFATSTGSACSSGDLDPSHVLLALGRSRAEAAASLRLTLGQGTDEAAVGALAAALPPVVARVRQLAV